MTEKGKYRLYIRDEYDKTPHYFEYICHGKKEFPIVFRKHLKTFRERIGDKLFELFFPKDTIRKYIEYNGKSYKNMPHFEMVRNFLNIPNLDLEQYIKVFDEMEEEYSNDYVRLKWIQICY